MTSGGKIRKFQIYSSSLAASPLFLLCFLAYLWFLKNFGSIYTTITKISRQNMHTKKCTVSSQSENQLKEYPFGGGVTMAFGLLDAILVGLVWLVVCCVILRFRHFSPVLSSASAKNNTDKGTMTIASNQFIGGRGRRSGLPLYLVEGAVTGASEDNEWVWGCLIRDDALSSETLVLAHGVDVNGQQWPMELGPIELIVGFGRVLLWATYGL